MAPDGKHKKRKAALATTSTDAPQKMSKKQRIGEAGTNLKKKEPKVSDTVAEVEVKNSAPVVATSSINDANLAAVKSKKARKQAADFLSDDEEAAPVVESSTKPKKKSKNNSAKENIVAVVDPVAEEKAALPVQTNRKKGKTTISHPVERLDQLLGTSAMELKDRKIKNQKPIIKSQQNGEPLTADGINGVAEHSDTEDAHTIAPTNNVSNSMQAEAQRTVDRELKEEAVNESEDAYEINDQAAALLAGFDSSEEDNAKDEGLEGLNLEEIAGSLKLSNKLEKQLKKIKTNGSSDEPGAVVLTRIPHGFYEHEMRAFFSQFGIITKLRLSRNKRTGASKHYAFIEFEYESVAKIVEKAMDNYLMFNHILKCKFASPGSLHPDTWKGANQRYKKVPHTKLEGKRLEEPKSKEKWQFKVDKEQKKREAKAEKLRLIGYEYDLPKIETPNTVIERKKHAQEDSKKIDTEPEEPARLIDPPNGIPKDDLALAKGKKSKKNKNGKEQVEAAESGAEISVQAAPAIAIEGKLTVHAGSIQLLDAAPKDAVAPANAKKNKKGKVSSDTVKAEAEAPVKAPVAPDIIKPVETKKSKKKSNLDDHAAAQKQLNEELISEVAAVAIRKADNESDAEIAATKAILPVTPTEGKAGTSNRRKRQSNAKQAGANAVESPIVDNVVTSKVEKPENTKKRKSEEVVGSKKVSKKPKKSALV